MNCPLTPSVIFAYTWEYPPTKAYFLILRGHQWNDTYHALWYSRGLDQLGPGETPYNTLAMVNHARGLAGGHMLVDQGGDFYRLPDGGVVISPGSLALPDAGGPTNPSDLQIAEARTGAYLALQQFRLRTAEMLHLCAYYGERRPHNPANQNT